MIGASEKKSQFWLEVENPIAWRQNSIEVVDLHKLLPPIKKVRLAT